MSVRVYLLLDIVERSCEYAVQMLRTNPNVILADRLEGYPNIITTVEAADRQGLAAAVMPVLDCLDGITEDLRLLVTQDGDISPGLLASNDSVPHVSGQEEASSRVRTVVSTRR
jgi:hypothetical protein